MIGTAAEIDAVPFCVRESIKAGTGAGIFQSPKKMQHFLQNVAFFIYTLYFGAFLQNLTPILKFFLVLD